MSTRKNMFSDLYDKARLLVFDAPAVEAELLDTPIELVPMIPSALPPPKDLMSPEHREEIENLLIPIADDEPCGPALRYDPVFTEIRLAREEDDPTLPMGQWERPLKRADWALIETRSKAMLTTRSKDLQIAAWLLEAWTRQHAFDGLYRGLALMDRLLRQFWGPLHPVIDDGDCDARVAPLQWLNESISVTLKVHVPFLYLPGRKPPRLTFADWERMTAKELSGQLHAAEAPKAGDPTEPPLTREDVIAHAQQHMAGDLEIQVTLVQNCLLCLDSLSSFVNDQLGMDSPNLSKLRGTLEAIERVLTQLLPERKGPEMTTEITQTIERVQAKVDEVIAPVILRHGWENRNEAYATLNAIADYLSSIEPHSPTPYLLRRAVNWGRMPLPELMAEIIREEGDLNRLANVLGLKE